MFRKKSEPKPLFLAISEPVWFFLVKVLVTDNNVQPWVAGSEAMVQAYVPGHDMSECLQALDAHLASQELTRVDTSRCIRYEASQEFDELPENHIREPLEEASRTGSCVMGLFIVDRETAVPHQNPS